MQIHDLSAEERTKIILQKGSVASCLPSFPSKETPASLNPLLPAAGAARSLSASDALGSLHVDGVRVLLAQRFVFLGVERLPLQIHVADCANEAGVMPGVSQSFNKLVTGLHREIAAMTLGAE